MKLSTQPQKAAPTSRHRQNRALIYAYKVHRFSMAYSWECLSSQIVKES